MQDYTLNVVRSLECGNFSLYTYADILQAKAIKPTVKQTNAVSLSPPSQLQARITKHEDITEHIIPLFVPARDY